MGKKATKWIPVLIAATLLCVGCRKGPDPSPVPTPTATPVPTLSPEVMNRGLGQVVISEFMEKNRAVLRDEDGDFSDWIELYNQSGETVSLTGWTVSDKEHKLGWALPETQMEPGQRLLIFASGKDRAGQQLHTDFALSGDEGVYLRNEHGTLISSALCAGCEADVATTLPAAGILCTGARRNIHCFSSPIRDASPARKSLMCWSQNHSLKQCRHQDVWPW